MALKVSKSWSFKYYHQNITLIFFEAAVFSTTFGLYYKSGSKVMIYFINKGFDCF